MSYSDLREFLKLLESKGQLKRISQPISPELEMTEICDRVLRAGGPAILFENVVGHDMPVLGNLFGTPERVALGMGQENVEALREVGKLLAFLKEPEPPKGMKDAWQKLPIFKQVLNMSPKTVKKGLCQQVVIQGDDVDLNTIPIQTCWPGDAGPLVTWPLVITRGPHKERQNLGIYRMQLIGRNKLIMRWLSHRGGATLGAVTPVPDTLSEYGFAGLLRGRKTEVCKSLTNDLQVPSTAEIILEGYLEPGEEDSFQRLWTSICHPRAAPIAWPWSP